MPDKKTTVKLWKAALGALALALSATGLVPPEIAGWLLAFT